MTDYVDAIVIGGGPAGSTIGYLLCEHGLRVVIIEKERFPRFHIGESLLPASNRIFKRLNILSELRSRFIAKPGGKWYYDEHAVSGEFSQADRHASFYDDPVAMCVERAEFDQILLNNAKAMGAVVLEEHEVRDMLFAGNRVSGVVAEGKSGVKQFKAPIVFDCSGQRAVVESKLGMRRPTNMKRMAVFSHYQCDICEPQARQGWFVGSMVNDGWVWTIPIGKQKLSIGVVTSIDEYRKIAKAPELFLERQLETVSFLRTTVPQDAKRVEDVRVMGNMGYTSDQFYGHGWVAVGDAAFFIDPCYSTGVHLALYSAELAADCWLKAKDRPAEAVDKIFSGYQRTLRRHEKIASKWVESFYISSTNKLIRSMTRKTLNSSATSPFLTFVGGDFDKNHLFINYSHFVTKMIDRLF